MIERVTTMVKRVKRPRGASLLLSRIAQIPLTLLPTVIAAHWLGPTQLGLYASAMAGALAVNALGLAGLDQLFLRGDLSLNSFYRMLYSWQLIYMALVVIAGSAIHQLIGGSLFTFILAGVSTSLTSLASIRLLVPQKRLGFSERAIREILTKATPVPILLCAAAIFPGTATAALLATAFSGMLTLLLIEAMGRKRDAFDRQDLDKLNGLRAITRNAFPLATSSALFMLYRQLPLLVIAAIASSAVVGQVRVMLTVYALAQIVAVTLNHEVLRPRLYNTKGAWTDLLRTSLALNLATSVLTGAAGFLLAPWAVNLAFGAQYESSGFGVRWMLLFAPFFFLSSMMDTVMIAHGKTRAVIIRLLVVVAFALILLLSVFDGTVLTVAWALIATEVCAVLVLVPSLVLVWREKR